MKIVICWAQVTGYLSACWKALATEAGVELSVIGFRSGGGSHSDFQSDVAAGLDCRFLSEDERNDPEVISQLVVSARPDVIVLCGWFHEPYTRLAFHQGLSGVKWIMGMDTPWRGTMRQRFGRLRVGKLIDRMDLVVVSGERSWQLARALKVPERKIRRGVYGIDFKSFCGAYNKRLCRPEGWPRRFLFVGRYVKEKGLDTLLAAYRLYRSSVPNPWTLSCCGMGSLSKCLLGIEGVEDVGFLQPHLLPDVFLDHGVFVIASRFDPWPLVVVEACAAGLPIICTEACGSAVELVRAYYNGFTVATDDVKALAEKMIWMHLNYDALPSLGFNGISLASAYSAEVWAESWRGMCAEVLNQSRPQVVN